MKKNLRIILILTAILTILTGCSAENFFDVRSAMSPPALSEEQISIKNSIREYLGSDYKFSYLMIDDKFSSLLKFNVEGGEYMVVFCETNDKFMKSHCIFFEKKSGSWIIKDDVVGGNYRAYSASVKDINGDGLDEIIIDGFDENSSNLKRYVYQVQKNEIVLVR